MSERIRTRRRWRRSKTSKPVSTGCNKVIKWDGGNMSRPWRCHCQLSGSFMVLWSGMLTETLVTIRAPLWRRRVERASTPRTGKTSKLPLAGWDASDPVLGAHAQHLNSPLPELSETKVFFCHSGVFFIHFKRRPKFSGRFVSDKRAFSHKIEKPTPQPMVRFPSHSRSRT